MSAIDEVISIVRQAADQERFLTALARASNLPYSTIREWQARGWTHPALDTLQKLEAGARQLLAERQTKQSPEGSPASGEGGQP